MAELILNLIQVSIKCHCLNAIAGFKQYSC